MSELERENINSILAGWIEAAVMPSVKQRDEFREFLDWAAFYGLRMPDVGGDQVAVYLLEMLADGASLSDVKRAANAIAACYDQRRCFLDLVPVRAALKIAAAQLAPGRILN